MAFYRCGGGSGIPSQVNTDMNNVLNKKFSTSGQTYPPLEWAEDVNLLGLLEEKTASGAIASITDGAEGVPLKNWLVTLPASLSGVSSLAVTKAGESLANIADVSGSMTNAYFYNIGSDYVLTAGTTYKIVMEVNSTVTPFAVSVGVGDNAYRYDIYNTGINNKNGIVAFEFTVEASHIATWNKLWIRAPRYSAPSEPATPTTCTFTVKNITLYTSAIVYTSSLGRTIYGGTVDIVTGEGEDGYGYVDLGSFTWVKVTSNVEKPYFSTTSALNPAYKYINSNPNVKCSKYSYGSIGSTGTANGFYVIASSYVRIRDDATENMTANEFKAFITGTKLVYELATPEEFNFEPITPTPETPLGVSNWWSDNGDSTITYRSSGTVTPVPVVPTLITKTITDNGTYNAEDDDADGYSEVTVNVQGGETPFVPQFTETKIADNSSHASSFTLSEDYGNYDMVKIVWWESATVSGFLYTTPDILDEIFTVGGGKLCINKPSTNYYICYTASGLTWTQTNQRNIYVHEIYGVTFTNCSMTATDLYKRGAITVTKYAITSQTSLKDYDLFMMSSIHATDGSETMPTTWLYQYPPENMSDAFSCPVPTVLQEYNANDEAFVISEYGMTAARFFMVQGIKFTPSTPNLLSMGGLTSSNEEPTEPEETENSEEEEE